MTDFDGETYEPERDQERLKTNLDAVLKLMRDHAWHSAIELEEVGGGAWSSRVRDLRKSKFGGHPIASRCISAGLWEYRLLRPDEELPQKPVKKPGTLAGAIALITAERDEAQDRIDRALALMDRDPTCSRADVRKILEGDFDA